MGSPAVAYLPGGTAAAISQSSWLVLDEAPSSELAVAAAAALSTEAGPGPILDVLTHGGTRQPGFALVSMGATVITAFVRGTAIVTIESNNGTSVVSASDGSLTEQAVDVEERVMTVTLSLGEPTRFDGVPGGAGLVAASALMMTWTDAGFADDGHGTLIWNDVVQEQQSLVETAETIRRSSVTDPKAGTPQVMAVRCPGGHLNAPHTVRCRVCNTNVPAQEAVAVPRPPMGRLITSTGAVVYLDRNVVIGRGPTELVGSVGPTNLVPLGVDNDRVSRNHVEVVIDGWRVLVRDLHSKNGTTVTEPGRPPRGLTPGEPWELEALATVTIGDGASFEFRADIW